MFDVVDMSEAKNKIKIKFLAIEEKSIF